MILGTSACSLREADPQASAGDEDGATEESGDAQTGDGGGADLSHDGKDGCLAEGPEIRFALDVYRLDFFEVDLPCTVLERSVMGTVTSLGLNCLEGDAIERFELELELEPGHEVPLRLGDVVRFRWASESYVEWRNRFLRIETPDGQHIVSGIQATDLGFTFADGAPVLPYELLSEPAPCEPTGDALDCSWQPMNVTFLVEDGPLVLGPHEHAFVTPGRDIWVGRAKRLLGDDACKGIWAPAWYSVLIVSDAN